MRLIVLKFHNVLFISFCGVLMFFNLGSEFWVFYLDRLLSYCLTYIISSQNHPDLALCLLLLLLLVNNAFSFVCRDPEPLPNRSYSVSHRRELQNMRISVKAWSMETFTIWDSWSRRLSINMRANRNPAVELSLSVVMQRRSRQWMSLNTKIQ